MLSKNKIKFIQSLNRKKVRDQEQLFLIEGNKMAMEAIDSGFQVELICTTEDFHNQNLSNRKLDAEVIICSHDEIRKASQLQHPQQALAIAKIPQQEFNLNSIKDELSLALDFIQDPGNLGTIIRIADWFGITHVLCSENTVDCFNPKVIQASMGAIFRVKIIYLNLPQLLSDAIQLQLPTYGTFMSGNNIYKTDLTSNGILVMGNEGNGISKETGNLVSKKLHIPSFATNGSESLNVGTATAICCSEFRRRTI